MEIKDYIALGAAVISIFSLVVSISTFRQHGSESERTLRNQITDVISKLDSADTEWDKLERESANQSNNSYIVNRRSLLAGQTRFLARQAIYLTNQKPLLVQDFEYNRIADAFRSLGEFDQANNYYKKAIEAAENPYYKSIIVRAYAHSLFLQEQIEAARQGFRKSVDLVALDSDLHYFHTADTYQRWAIVEAYFSNWKEAQNYLEQARQLYSKINNEGTRNQGLADLEVVEQDIQERKSLNDG